MAKYVTVRVVDSSGRPQKDMRVGVWVGGTATGGLLPEKGTGSKGDAEFEIDDSYPRVTIYVNGQEKVSDEDVRAEFKIVI